MKIKKGVLVGFLNKCQMEGTNIIPEVLLKFGSEGLKLDANSPTQQARVMGWLKKGAFKEYEEIGNVGLNDLSTVIKVFGRFGEESALTKEGNLLTVKGNKKSVGVELVSEEFLNTDTGEPELKFEETFTTTAKRLKDIFADVKLNEDAVMTFETAEKKVKISNTGKYKFHNEIDAPSCKGGVKVTFGAPLIEAINKLDGVLELSIASNYPMKIMEKTDESVITFIVAPRIED